MNVPLPGNCGDAAFAAAFDEVIGPVAVRFRPDVIIVSAGYDGHWRDPLAGLQLCGGTFHRLAAELKKLGARTLAPSALLPLKQLLRFAVLLFVFLCSCCCC